MSFRFQDKNQEGKHGVRLVSALIDAPVDATEIGDAIEADWLAAANAIVPVFRLRGGS